LQVEDPEFLHASEELIKFYREYPEVAAEDLLLIELSDIQKVVLRSMWFKSYVMSIMCRGSGKTFLNAVFACLKAMLYPGYRIGLLAPTFRQCVVGDTLVCTDKGFQYVNEIKDPPSLILSHEGFSSCSHVFTNPAERTIKIKTKMGFELEGAPDHRVLVLDSGSKLVYRELSFLTTDDEICIHKGSRAFGTERDLRGFIPEVFLVGNTRDCFIPSELDCDLSYFLGLLTGDGCLTAENYIIFTNGDPSLLQEYDRQSMKYFGKVASRQKKDNHYDLTQGSKKFFGFLTALGLGRKTAIEKSTPSIILQSTQQNVCAYLQGLFDTDGGAYFYPETTHPYKVGFYNTSCKLIREVKVLLLNLGIISSSFEQRTSRKNTLYSLEISDKKSFLLFAELVGFRSAEKSKILEAGVEYVRKTDTNRCHSAVIRNVKPLAEEVCNALRKTQKGFGSLSLWKHFTKEGKVKPNHNLTSEFLKKMLEYCQTNGINCPAIKEIEDLVQGNLLFDTVVSKEYGFSYTYDFTVDRTHNYVSNGLVSHNSKMMFDECTKLWQRSPIFQAATERKPTQQSDNCYIRFKAVGGRNASVIQGIPLGDGSKIRGSRFYTILCDEFPHIPEDIFNMVIRPMAATVAEPMENVRRLRQQKKLLDLGLITQDEIDAPQAANQIIITSSGYFQFNHMFKLYCAYKEQQRNGNDKYAVFRVPYWLLPEGFLSEDNIEAAKAEMSSLQFRMEYEAAFIPDTDAFYKASLLDSCSTASFSPQVVGIPGKSYVLGIDPARSEDSFAISVVEVGVPAKVVHAIELRKQPFPRMAETIEDLSDAFNVTSIYMDAGGGGLAIKDILAENSRSNPKGPILDPEDEVHQYKAGRHILTMCDFTTEFISTSNFAALRLLEHRDILFPNIPKDFEPTFAQEEAWSTIQTMKLQMQTIELTETPTGKHHFDVPRGEGHGKQKKDLYTSFILAARAVYDMLWSEQLPESVLYHGGVLTPREEKNPITFIGDPELGASVMNIPDALREKLEISLDPDAYRMKMLQGMQHSREVLTSPTALLKPKPGKKK
jgi:intein/homing endonuclease